ncbi:MULTISPECIES: 1-(5-phosphoribosyl)-5-[(5-phosphoribosylamino)methylideneamino]imidazole-4-carboxamide isomerase [Allobacillus]|uniref:1-(5-phosphoribosyl)-5-[(5-phosphoribosylamino)methylideneamino] imidazole-4-carboxamide isomerase n=1 Tax=Allobacillus halotolerans TaxID=570278 RepID=A0ABS6GKL1_9BACI|nr:MULTISPECIES: 1-(5-phosphoribosyl)-5-[(5-phosphoribosylamino)methylideneamino]imidazole-4-carboxamide isomerase [Allobacillus]MBU6079712.1 1-(5-phosphoribosyl)-5-[(5-phosphoribosylamino)methylideneamino]imidazole-4-carboxamide isomerase [Allobacillus halotolerans]TSJ68239.1 1-(5-phosphoribosyl)-5-[(5-phosphoribosylamino)methylideneamino]imidazole-4-carboxamide isomerase [Allobacillus sp. SKP2-8]
MNIYPAIDIKDQQCVRLIQGDYNQQTEYGDPVLMAKKWKEEGAKYLHLVDLDAAKGDPSNNLRVIQKIIDETGLPVQVGGGVRSIGRIKELLKMGVSRVILGTAAVKDPEFLQEAAVQFGEQIVVSIDARNGYVATDGWLETSEVDAIEFLKTLEKVGVKTVVYTDIFKDGMLQGPNLQELNRMNTVNNLQVIASGGVSSVKDIEQLKEMNIYGAIVGKAIYEGKVNLKKVMEV